MARATERHRLHWPATISSTERVRIVVYVLIALILACLASALVFVFRGSSKRAVKALALRVALSIALFMLLMAGFHFGYIPAKL